MLYDADILKRIQFTGLQSWQTAANDDDSIRAQLLSFSDILSALGRGTMGNTAGIDDNHIGCVSGLNLLESELFK